MTATTARIAGVILHLIPELHPLHGLIERRVSASPREPPHDIDQLVVSGAGRIAELIDRVRISQTAQAEEFANALPSVQLQLGWPTGEQDAPQLAVAKQVVELGCRHINQKQNQDPQLDRG